MGRLLDWAARRRSAVVTGVGVLVVATLVTTVAVASSGYEAQRLDLSDGTVWVANGERAAIGRANTDVLQLNSAVRSSGADISVAQRGQDVLLVDRGNATVGVVDTATAQIAESVPLPPESPEVSLAGDRALVVSQGTGEVWSQPLTDLSSFSNEVDPDLSLGKGLVTSVTPEGTVAAYSSDTGEVSVFDGTTSPDVAETHDVPAASSAGYQVATVGDHWAVLDTGAGALVVDGRQVDLSDRVSGGLALQTGSDTGDGVLVATSTGLLSVSFDGDRVTEVVDGRDGKPTRPVLVDDCRFAAWAGGSAWSDCASSRGGVLALDDVPGGADLVFDVNEGRVVLNDPATGRSWAVQRAGQLIDNWSDLFQEDRDREEQQENDDDQPPELDPDQKAPVAVDDAFGARPGRASTLPVLLNDYDPNGDPLVVEQTETLDDSVGRIDLVNDRQQVLLTLADTASGSFAFEYTITDGRGGQATATVTVTVRQAAENSPPGQVRNTTAAVSSSGRVTSSVLGDWVDPDGDAFYLTSAGGAAGVSYKPSGDVVYQDAGAGEAAVDVPLTVSDGRDEGRGSLAISIMGAGQVPLEALAFSQQAYAGQQLTVRPLSYARGGTGTIKLNSVPAKADVTVTPNYEQGTFRFASDAPGTHLLEYTVTDGDQTATGTVRIDVQSPPDAGTPPITTPKTVFVETLGTQTLDVVATDRDPANNVLMLTATDAVPVSSGVKVETLDQRYARVTLTAPLEDGPVTFGYTVSNGLASAVGTVTVVEIPRRAITQPPIATDDQVTVRVGDSIDVAVLANDEQPDGDELSLVPRLETDVPAGSGLLFASGNRLRYLAPSSPGNVTATYTVEGPDGQRASAQVAIAVREVDAGSNAAPAPQAVTARVVAGETVRVGIPLDGIDPDGDSVQLLGVGTNPEKGSVSTVGTDYVEYQANASSAGTDSFTYTVVDGLGARATGTVRVGISTRADGSRNPIAVADAVTMRPGGSITVRVLDNDSDPDGGALSVDTVEPNGEGIVAKVVSGTMVSVTPPESPGTYGLVYTVSNQQGGQSSTFVTVTVDPDAPLNYPLADDTVLGLSDIAGRQTVTVNPLTNVFFSDGSTSRLDLALEPGFGTTAEVTPNSRVTVRITDSSQIIPFSVARKDDPGVRAYAFIVVPGFDDALPQIDRTVRPVSVESEKAVTIDLNRYVISAGTNGVRLTDPGTVRATNSNGDDLVVDDTTLRFTSADLFSGTASISFQVTDGRSADDPDGRTASLVLPITVTSRENQPPVFNGVSVDLEPGQSRTLDLDRLTTYPYPDDLDELTYSVDQGGVAGFGFDLSGSRLTVSADAGTVKGTSRSLPVAVSDALNQGRGGTVTLSVVGSTRPLAQPAADRAVVRRGASTTVDVLQNDQATNPFPGQALRVVAIRGLNGGSVPAGVSITPSGDNRSLAVSVAASAAPGDTNLQYQVADVTNDPDRYVWGTVAISVQDVPNAPNAPVRTGTFTGGQLTLSYTAPAANNSPLTGYRLTGLGSAGGSYTKDCGLATVCTLTDLDPEQTFRFSVTAVNGIGESADSASSEPYSADYVPAAPTGVTLSPSRSTPLALDLSWNAVPRPVPGTSVRKYVVEMTGPNAPPTFQTSEPGRQITGLVAGASYTATVHAENAAMVTGSADWARTVSSVVEAVGTPAGVQVTATVADGGNGWVALAFPDTNVGAKDKVSYSFGRANGNVGAPVCSPTQKPNTVTLTDGVDRTAQDGQTYTYFVYASNSLFCTASASGAIQSLKNPGQASATVSVERHGLEDDYDVRVTNLASSGDVPVGKYEARVGTGAWRDVEAGDFLTSRADSSVYGRNLSISIRACRDDSDNYCGDASTVSAVPVSFILLQPVYVAGDTAIGDARKGSWSIDAPGLNGLTEMKFRCGESDLADLKPGANTCDGEGDLLRGPPLTIVLGANGTTYTKTYDAPLG
jgi:hypothetical protein